MPGKKRKKKGKKKGKEATCPAQKKKGKNIYEVDMGIFVH